MSINPGVGYSVTNLGNTVSLDIETYLPEQEPKQFECSIVRKGGENPEYHLRVRRGLIEFDYFRTDENGIIDKDKFGVKNTDLVYGQDTDVTMCYLYAPYFNLYPNGKKVSGSNILDAEYLDNGYIKLEEGEDYFVFVYKVTPDFPSGMPPLPPPSETHERTAPQIAVMKAGEDFINAGDNSNGSGSLVMYLYNSDDIYAHPPLGRDYEAFASGGYQNSGYNGTYSWYNPVGLADSLSGYVETWALEGYTPVAFKQIVDQKIGFRESSCIRKDIAYIKWNAGLKRFQIFQINYGPISIRQQPIGPISIERFESSEFRLGWTNEGRDWCNDITDPIDGYSKSLNQLQNCSIPGFVNEKKYQKPFETA
jgi:hypothetical protein